MKVKVLKSFSTLDKSYTINEVVEEDASLVKDWLRHGLVAEEATTEQPKKKNVSKAA
jgi:hypothetical protein